MTNPPAGASRSLMPVVWAIIAGALLVVGAMVIIEQRREYNERWPGCWQLIGENLKCKADVASRRLMGL